MLSMLALLVLGGAFVGLLSGLLGVGGAVIIMPLLNVFFDRLGFSVDTTQHLSLGTSLATILFTSLSSVLAHRRYGSVRADIWKKMAPGIIAGTLAAYTVTVMWGATLVGRLLIAFVFPLKNPRKAMVGMSVLCTVFYVLLVMAHTQGAAIALLFGFAISMSGLNPTAVASAGRMTSVTSMGIMLPVASSGAILMPWVIGIVAERAGLAAGMASNIVPCVGLVVFTLLVARLPEE